MDVRYALGSRKDAYIGVILHPTRIHSWWVRLRRNTRLLTDAVPEVVGATANPATKAWKKTGTLRRTVDASVPTTNSQNSACFPSGAFFFPEWPL